MGPLAKTDSKSEPSKAARPRRGSLPDLKTATTAVAGAEKKVPTGPRANPLYKTRLCMNFQSTGSCPYTEKCQFAHGVAELEKWESWRSTHKPEDEKKEQNPEETSPSLNPASSIMDGRARAHSEDTHRQDRSASDFSDLSASQVNLLNWDLSTPVKSLIRDDPIHGSSSPTSFSYWSKFLGDLDETPEFSVAGSQRSRASTFDSPTYDNMSQLRDAPTLFPVPPVLVNLKRLSLS